MVLRLVKNKAIFSFYIPLLLRDTRARGHHVATSVVTDVMRLTIVRHFFLPVGRHQFLYIH